MSDQTPGRVLVVDDEEPLLRAYGRYLAAARFNVDIARTGDEAVEQIASTRYDVILSDISMPGMNGIELLRAVRDRDPDVPVILMTGNPSVTTAVQAVEYGALRYLLKPVAPDTLVETVSTAAKLQRIARLKREALGYLGVDQSKLISDRATLEATLASGIASLWMAFQPIVEISSHRVVAFEALVRTHEPALSDPGVLFSVAERVQRLHEVGRTIRSAVASTVAEQPTAADIFVNLHPLDLTDSDLYSVSAPLSAIAPQVVLELTERMSLDELGDLPGRFRTLRALGYRIAIDDLGAGYAGLSYFSLLNPEVVKLDMSLIRNVDSDPMKQKLVGSFTTLCRELGMRVVAEGIETAAERDMVEALGGDLVQGNFFSKPGPAFPEVNWV